MGYSDYGFLMHDAWWRDNPGGTGEGYLTNLPHYDPIAFNSGSHGCINFHYAERRYGESVELLHYRHAGDCVLSHQRMASIARQRLLLLTGLQWGSPVIHECTANVASYCQINRYSAVPTR